MNSQIILVFYLWRIIIIKFLVYNWYDWGLSSKKTRGCFRFFHRSKYLFIQFEKLKFTTADGMTIQNSTIRPKLVELLSEVLQMPLELISGSISSLTLNKPWEKLFLFMNSPIKIITEGIRLRTKLKSTFSEDFTLRKKRHLIESLT